jgi:hypothetical protein
MSEESARGFVDQVREIAAAAKPESPEQALDALRENVHAVLTSELKYAEVEWNEQRNLRFAVEDRYFLFAFHDDDPQFLAIHSGAIAAFDEAGCARALVAASATTQALKVAKLVVQPIDGRWLAGASAELLLPSLDAVDKAFVRRLVRLVVRAIADFEARLAQPPSP